MAMFYLDLAGVVSVEISSDAEAGAVWLRSEAARMEEQL